MVSKISIVRSDGKQYDVLIDDVDYERVSSFIWHIVDHKKDGIMYANNKQNGLMHRFILGLKLGDGYIIDHINGNGLDNRRNNLRAASATANSRNRRTQKNNTSGTAGVVKHKPTGKWFAQIRIKNRRVYSSLVDSKKEAEVARLELEKKHWKST